MKVSKEGIEALHGYESLRLEAYPDPLSKDGKPVTIGYGSTGPDIKLGMKWTKAQADERFARDLEKFEQGVSSAVRVPLDQCQFDALVSLAYNIGLGAFKSSTLLKLLNKAEYFEAADQFLVWCNASGKKSKGLLSRREKERKMFLGIH